LKLDTEKKGRNWKRFERWAYFVVGASLVTLVGILIWDRGGSPSAMGSLFQAGTAVVIPYSVLLMVLALRGSSFARLLMVSTISTVAAVCLVEIFLQVCECSQRGYSSYESEAALERLDAIEDLQEKGIEVYPYIPPSLLREMSSLPDADYFLSNIGNALTVYDNEDDGLIITPTDENGFRNQEGIYSKTATFDVFLLGDSFTEGCCVPNGYTIADVIRRTTPLTVYNAGKNGIGLVHNLAIFIEYGLPKKPSNVILVMPENLLINRTTVELGVEQLQKYYTEHRSNGLIAKSDVKDELLSKVVASKQKDARLRIFESQYGGPPARSLVGRLPGFLNSKSRVVQLAHSNTRLMDTLRFFPNTGHVNSPIGDLSDTLPAVHQCDDDYTRIVLNRQISKEWMLHENQEIIMEDILSWMQSKIQEYGGTFTVVYFPHLRFFSDQEWYECERELLVDLTDELDIELIDLVPVMSNLDHPRTLFAHTSNPFINGHLNREGYRLIGEQISDRLVNNR